MPDPAVKSRDQSFDFHLLDALAWHTQSRPRTAHVSPARLLRAHSSFFFVVCSLATAPSSPKSEQCIYTSFAVLCYSSNALRGSSNREELLHRRVACCLAVLGAACVLVQGYPVCRDCPSTPLWDTGAKAVWPLSGIIWT